MAIFYGSDTSCVGDVGLVDVQVTDPRILVGQRIARRLTTPRGALAVINDDPAFGWDCKQYVNAKLRPTDITTAQSQIQKECLKDEQVQTASVVLTLSQGALTISVAMVSSAGPFILTLNVSDLTTDLVFTFQ